MICTSVAASSIPDVLRDIAEAAGLSDMVEVRLDTVEGIDAQAIDRIFRTPCRVPRIATCRPHREGGEFGGGEAERLDLLRVAEAAGAEYLDIEAFAWDAFPRAGTARRIISYHNFIETPADLGERVAGMARKGADVLKVSTFVKDLRDNLALLATVRGAGRPCIAIGMGEAGVLSRVLAVAHGGYLTYACLSPEKATAPGQVPIRTLRGIYRFDQLRAGTPLYGVLGNPISHSLGPAVHNAAFEAAGLPGAYLPLLVERFPGIVGTLAGALPFRGFSVTIPHKEAALSEVDEADPIARKAQAVNTISLEGGRRQGSNTDAAAVVAVLQDALKRPSLANLPALVVGAGGSARGAAAGLMAAGARVTVWNRTSERARRLAETIGCTAVRDQKALPAIDFAIVANATSIGMNTGVGIPVDPRVFRAGQAVLDLVYTPPDTEFLAEAKRRGAIPVSGLSVFLRQAALQFERWTGRRAPAAVMEEAARRALKEREAMEAEEG